MATTTHNWGTSANFDEGQFKKYFRVTGAAADNVYATTAALVTAPAVYTTSVWPHTLTCAGLASAAVVLSVDGANPPVNALIIVKNQATAAHNGVYRVTNVGVLNTTLWIMERVVSWVNPVKRYSYAITTAGSTNSLKGYYLDSQVNVIGTDSVTMTQSALIAPVCKFVTEAALPNATYPTADTIQASSGTLTINGVAVVLNDRILVRNEVAGARNGIYNCTQATAPYILTRVSGYNAAAQPIPAQTTFTCNAVSVAIPLYYNSVWYLYSAVTTVGTTTWDIRTCTGGFATGYSAQINTGAIITINSDTFWGSTGQQLGPLTVKAAASKGGGLSIDGTKTWWTPFDSGTGTVPDVSIYGTVDVTRSAVGIAQYLGIWTTTGAILNNTPVLPGVAMPVEGFIKFRQLENGVTLADNDVLTLPGSATVTVNSSTGGQYGWLQIGGITTGVFNMNNDASLTTNGQWFYLDNASGYSGQRIQTPFIDQITAVQIETGSGTNVFEWWLGAGVFGGTANTTLKWGLTTGMQTDVRAKYFGTTTSGVIQLAPRGICRETFADCKYATATAVLPNTPTYATGTQVMTAGANSTLTVDGSVVALTDRVLVKDQATASQNGIYICTDAGSGATPWKLTRTTDCNIDLRTIGAFRSTRITAGTANVGRYFTLQNTVSIDQTNPSFINHPIVYEIPEVRIATTAALTVTYDSTYSRLTNNTTLAALTIDSVALAVGDRVLVKDQASTLQNGIYEVTNAGSGSVAWTMKREFEFDISYQPIPKNAWTRVLEGTTNALTCWVLDAAVNTIGTDAVTWISGGTGWDFASCRVATDTRLPACTYSAGVLTQINTTTTPTDFSAITIDNITLSVNDRILVTREGTAANNGIYTVTTVGNSTTAWVLTRSTDFNTGPIYYNQRVFVTSGNYARTTWTLQKNVTTIGTTAVRWGLGEPNTEWLTCKVATNTILPNTPGYTAATGVLLSGVNAALIIDGYTAVAGDIVLVKDQATTAQNGIYKITAIGSGAAQWSMTRMGDTTAGQIGFNETFRAIYGAIGKYVGAAIMYGNVTTTTLRDTYWYLSAPITAAFSTSPAVTFIRGCPSSQFKSVEWVATANLTVGVATAPDRFTSATAVDGCPAASMTVGDRILVTTATNATQVGIYECTISGATPTWDRCRGMNSLACSTTAAGDGAIGTHMFVQVNPGAHHITAVSTANQTSWVMSIPFQLIGTTAPSFTRAAGYGGFCPPAGARIRMPNVYCGVVVNIAPITTTPILGAFQQPYYGTTLTDRFPLTATLPIININYTNLNWLISFANPVRSFSMQNSAWAETLTIAETINDTTALINNCASGLLYSTATAAQPATATSPVVFLRVKGLTLTDLRVTHATSATPPITLNYCNNLTMTRVQAENFGGAAAQTFERSAAVNAYALTGCDNVTINTITAIGGQLSLTNCNGVIINGYYYADKLAGQTNATNPQTALVVVTSNSIILNGFDWFGELWDVHPYSAIMNTSADDFACVNIGAFTSPLFAGSLAAALSHNIGSFALTTSTQQLDNHEYRRLFMTNFRTAQGFIASLAANRIFKNVEFTNIMHDTATTYHSLSDNVILRGIYGTDGTTAVAACIDNNFRTYFGTSFNAGTLSIAFNAFSSVSSAYITLSGNAYLTASGILYMNDLSDQAIFEWPYVIYGYTAFTNTTATLTGANTGNMSYEYALNTSGSYGSWKVVNGTNLSGETISPSVGFRIKFRFITTVQRNAATGNNLTYFQVAMTTTRTGLYNLYPLPTTTVSAIAGRVTVSDNYGVRSAVQLVRLVNTATSSTSSADWEPAVDPFTGREIYVRKYWTSTQTLPLYPRIGDTFSIA